MSLILEALRKSEAERRRGEAPDLLRSDPAPAAVVASPWSWWMLAVPALLALALLAWWPRDAGPPGEIARPAPAGTSAPRRLHEASTAAPATMPVIERLQPAPPPPTPVPTPRPAVAARPVAPAPAATPPAVDESPIAIGALTPAQRKALPPLRLSMHLWNEDPARRVAILDGKRVTPGDRVGEAVVADIRPDGVLLEWAGRQVLVPLP